MNMTLLLNTIYASHDFLWGEIYISCTVGLITVLMQHSLMVTPVNTNLPLANSCTQCTVIANFASAYKVQFFICVE